MPKEFIKETGNPAGYAGERGSITRAILFVLLLLTAVLGYLYFFTGLIKPREYVAKEPPPMAAPVKHPLPPRPDRDAANVDSIPEPAEEPAAVSAEQKPSPASPEKNAAKVPSTKAGPALAPVAAPAPPSSTKPAVAVTSPKPAAVKGKPAATAEKPAAKVAAKVAAVSASPPVKAGTAKSVKPAAKVKASPASAEPKKSVRGDFSLLLGEYANDREAERARQKLAKLGISGVNSRKTRKVETMHRLFLAEFTDREAAEAELRKLSPIAGGAFILKENGRYSLYAGSYFREKGASSESRRLAGKGIKLVPRTATVTLSMCELTTGPFPDREKAQKEADRLKNNGFAARVVEQGK